ncbi:MAG TPA: hypothetical protein VE991_02075 [Acidimicrobiales bacterium]|nr:hypothetical protein [Acidimicrobiales bacterium]
MDEACEDELRRVQYLLDRLCMRRALCEWSDRERSRYRELCLLEERLRDDE